MPRSRLLILLLLAIAQAGAACTRTPDKDVPPTDETDNENVADDQNMDTDTDGDVIPVVTLPPGGPRAATMLQAEVDCDPTELGEGIARLSWMVGADPGEEQRVAVTVFPDGFERGDFQISVSLPPDQAFLVWNQVAGRSFHRWRVLTLHAEGWVPSETATFEGPACPVGDFVPNETESEDADDRQVNDTNVGQVDDQMIDTSGEQIVVTLPPGGRDAATGLKAEVDCDPTELGEGIARLSWTPGADPGEEQRVAVTIFPDGFERGDFQISVSLPPDQASHVWKQVVGRSFHRWRVLTLHAEGWVPSKTATFVGPACPVGDLVMP